MFIADNYYLFFVFLNISVNILCSRSWSSSRRSSDASLYDLSNPPTFTLPLMDQATLVGTNAIFSALGQSQYLINCHIESLDNHIEI